MLAVDTMMSGERGQGAFLCLKWAEMSLTDFRTVKVTGESISGEVRVVQKVGMGGIYAMKTSKEEDILKEDQVPSLHPLFALSVMRCADLASHSPVLCYRLAHDHTERGVLAGSNSPWVVQLCYSFRDAT